MKIGIECHVQLSTKSKIFCSCPTQGSEKPNSRCCETCLGHPGSKPVLNIEALKQGIKVALALNCKIAPETFFSRKNYSYPDLCRNFQITQYEVPFSSQGNLEGIRIRRIHLEEDPGALIHKKTFCLIDYNRSGIPLIEIVTEPDFKSSNQVREFLKKLITILEYLDVYTRQSEATMKADINVSTTGERVEIKNISSLKEIERALDYEIARQTENPAKVQQTLGWDPNKGKTFLMREKETEIDYGYIFEPDLTKIEISQEFLKDIQKTIPELNESKLIRFKQQYKLPDEEASVLTSEIRLSNLFEEVAKKIDPILAARWLKRDLLKLLNYNKTNLREITIDSRKIIQILDSLAKNQITDKTAKELLIKLIQDSNFNPLDYIKKEKLEIISTISDLEGLCKEAIQENKPAIEDYKKGNEKAINFLVGAVMKKSKGKADPKKVEKILKELIKND